MIALMMGDSIEDWVDELLRGDVRSLAKAISQVESHAEQGAKLLAACLPYTGRALRIGITGAPGAGKSTLVDRLARCFREAGKTVGVLAVDPTSPYSGGAILGDRIRFQGFAGDAGFYARSMATRGALGGLARTTADVATVIEASGKEVILIETVGVGQGEVDVAELTDVTVVVLVPGMGDDVQGLKAGIMEIADIFVINKSDHEGAERAEEELKAAIALGHEPEPVWAIPIVRTVASTGAGVRELIGAIAQFETWLALRAESTFYRDGRPKRRARRLRSDNLSDSSSLDAEFRSR
jgi:LAO/AO transport system kinase